MKKNPSSNDCCRWPCWWWRWCAQGPTRRHFGCVKSILKSLRDKLFSSSDHQWSPPSDTFLTYFLTSYLVISGIHILPHIFSEILSSILFGTFWYIIFGSSLWLRSGGQRSDPMLALEVRENCDPELAVEVRRGTLWFWASCSGPAGNTAI